MNLTMEEKKLRKMYVRQNQLALIKYARKVHGEYVVNTTDKCDAQYNRKCIHAVVHTSLKTGWDVHSTRHVIDFLPLHCWNSKTVPPKYPQTVTLKFNSEKVKLAKCVLHADPKSYVSGRERATKQLIGRQWINNQGFVLTRNYMDIPQKFVDDDLRKALEDQEEDGLVWATGTFNQLKFGAVLPNGNFRLHRWEKGQAFSVKESFGTFGTSSSFTPYMLIDICV